MLLGHLLLQDDTAQMIKMNIALIDLHLGNTAAVFTYPFTHIATRIPSSWISTTWDFSSQLDITLHTSTFLKHPARVNDKAILKTASLHFSSITLQQINSVRIYLKAFYLSDIVSADGIIISPFALNHKIKSPCKSTHPRFNQQFPGSKAWKEWNHMIYSCFTIRLQSPILWIPLRQWLPSSLTTSYHP